MPTPMSMRRLRGPKSARVGRHVLDEEKFGGKTLNQANAAFTTWLIVLFLTPFWFLQFIIWAMSMAALGVSSIPIIGSLLPGATTFQAFTLFGIVLGILFMAIAFTIYLFRGVDCTSGWKMLVFAICLALSMAPIIFFIPWVFVWCFAVTVLQTGESNEE